MKAKIVGIVKETDEASSFYIQPIKPVTYKPGDFIYLILPQMHYPDLKGNIRHFSLSSSPTDGDILRITIKQGISGFKKTLFNLNTNDTVEIDGPLGVYPWPPQMQNEPQVFIVGGIGITPFISRLKFNLDNKFTPPTNLLYSNSESNNILFEKDLQNFSLALPNFKLIFHMSKDQGRISKNILKSHISPDATCWLTGPVGFVSDIEEMLYDLGIDQDHLKTEKFTGY